MSDGAGRAGGLLASVRNLADSLIGAAQTRLALFATDVEEQGALLARIAVLAVAGAFCIALAIVLGCVLLAVVFWDTHRVEVLAALTTGFAVAGAAVLISAWRMVQARPAPFRSTLDVLAKDRQALRPDIPPPAP